MIRRIAWCAGLWSLSMVAFAYVRTTRFAGDADLSPLVLAFVPVIGLIVGLSSAYELRLLARRSGMSRGDTLLSRMRTANKMKAGLFPHENPRAEHEFRVVRIFHVALVLTTVCIVFAIVQ